MKFWTRREIESLLESSGLTAKTGELRVVAGAHEVLPRRLGPVPVPLRPPGEPARRPGAVRRCSR